MATATAISDIGTVDVRDRADVRRQIKLVVVFGLVVLAVVLFWLKIDNPHVTYTSGERVSLDNPSKPLNVTGFMAGALVVSVVCLALAIANKVPKNWVGMVIFILVGLAFFVAFMGWSYTDQTGALQATILNPVPGAVRLSTPLIFGALAGCIGERAGVINIAIEGQFLLAAFCAAVADSLAYSTAMGLLGGVLAGMLMAALLGVFALRYQVNQIVVGVVLTALATGLTSFLVNQIPDDENVRQYLNEPLIMSQHTLPLLSSIPIVGTALFNQNYLVYLMYISVVVVTLILFQTKWGLRVRAVGEHPEAADTVGINVNRIRWQAILFGGIFAGLGGAYFTVGSGGAFDQNISAGNGFIALAAVIMGRWHPVGATFAALLFGFSFTLQAQLTFLNKIPPELLRASPYLITVIAVAGFVGRVRPPAADGEPYVKS
jgi:simple sugar transport system permease protein